MNGEIDALAVYNNELYAGGVFSEAGGIAANYIAAWLIDYIALETTAFPAGGTYTSTQTVTLTATDTDSTVTGTYYTTDGSMPTISSALYISPITISSNTTLKFFSVDSIGNSEAIKTETYIIDWRQAAENNLENGQQFTLQSELNQETISGQDLTIYFKKLPNKLTENNKYWMKWKKQSGYPNKAFLKNWKLTTNLNKYKAKKSSQKFKIKVTFKYTKKQLNKYLKKNKSATKSNLTVKYLKTSKSKWQNLTTAFTDAKLIKKTNKFIVQYFTNFPVKTQYFAIGVK